MLQKGFEISIRQHLDVDGVEIALDLGARDPAVQLGLKFKQPGDFAQP